MPTTVELGFEQLKQNLEITTLQKTTVSVRQQRVREAIEKELRVLDSFLIGSYSRHLMISPLAEADVDIFFVMDSSYYQLGPTGLLDRVKSVLLKTYTRTPEISKAGRAVTITFDDFKVDVVPGFYRQGEGFLIADSKRGEWISTNPTVHDEVVTKENAWHNGDLVPLIKMIKGWNKNMGHPFVSFYLELMALEILKNVTITDFPSGVRYFFDKGQEKIKYKVRDLVDFGGEINGLDNIQTVEAAVALFQNSYAVAASAEQFTSQWIYSSATIQWRRIFGDYFPLYG